MFKKLIPVFLTLIIAILVGVVAHAYVTPEARQAGNQYVFSTLTRQVSLTASTTASLTPTDLIPATIVPPYRLVIQNTGANLLHRGLNVPTATCTSLAGSATWDMVLHTAPNFNIRSTTGATTLCVEVWTAQ